jgi:CubicO group peptidase (beta-lactamase class C family)
LVEQGKLRLFDPVAAYLPDFAKMTVMNADGKTSPAKSPMIIEHLLTHRAGFSYGFLTDSPVVEHYRSSNINDANVSLEEMVTTISDFPLAFEPGSQWQYGVATDVLARIIEVILDRSLPEILNEMILKPLGMTDTGFIIPKADRSRLMAMFGKSDLDEVMKFDDKPQTLVPADLSAQYPVADDNFYRGGLGLYSTIEDYSRFSDLLVSGVSNTGERLLSSKTIELMWTNRIPDSQMPLRIGPIFLAGYGFGLAGRIMLDTGKGYGLTSNGEFGWTGAASTYFWIDRREDIIGITMAQYMGSKIPLSDDIRNAVYQALDD